MIIVHVTGPQCAGKTHLIGRFLEKHSVPVWDVLDFYERTGFCRNNTLDYGVWYKTTTDIKKDLRGFIEENAESKMIIVESSGTNHLIHELLANLNQDGISVKSVMLEFPTDKELAKRARRRGVPIQRAKETNDSIRNSTGNKGINQTEALDLLLQIYKEL